MGHKSSVNFLEFHPYGEFFVSCGRDFLLKVWDIRKKTCIQTYAGHEDSINVLRVSPDGTWLASGSDDGTVRVSRAPFGLCLLKEPRFGT